MQLGGPAIGESKSSFERERDPLIARSKDMSGRSALEAKENNFFSSAEDKGPVGKRPLAK